MVLLPQDSVLNQPQVIDGLCTNTEYIYEYVYPVRDLFHQESIVHSSLAARTPTSKYLSNMSKPRHSICQTHRIGARPRLE